MPPTKPDLIFTVTGLNLQPVRTSDLHYPRGSSPYGLYPGESFYIQVNNARNYVLNLDTWSQNGRPVDPPISPEPIWKYVKSGTRTRHTVNADANDDYPYKYCIYLNGDLADDPEIVIDNMLRDPRGKLLQSNTLTLTISEDGRSVTKSDDPFHMGTNGADFQIVVENGDLDPTKAHQLKIEKVHYVKTGAEMIPFTGERAFLVAPGGSKTANCKVKSLGDAPTGNYAYTIVLDNVELADPEIVVDSMDIKPGRRTKKSGAKRKGVAKTAKSRRKAKRTKPVRKKPAKKGRKKR